VFTKCVEPATHLGVISFRPKYFRALIGDAHQSRKLFGRANKWKCGCHFANHLGKGLLFRQLKESAFFARRTGIPEFLHTPTKLLLVPPPSLGQISI
jgi:hypothetical protein